MSVDPSLATAAGRKDDHVRLANEQAVARAGRTDFDDIELLHHALGGANTSDVDLSVEVAGHRWATPIYLNGMTGGTETTGRINRALAIVARETGMPMASGSVGIALDRPETAASFTVIRDENPDGFVMANIGVGRSVDHALRAIDLLHADALQVHVNAVQETVMPEGARDFADWPRELEAVIAASPVPVVVKEVGFGLSRRTLRRLADMGAEIADVSGRGGTDFARIENDRRDGRDFGFLSGHGQSAVASLLDAPETPLTLLASGGVRDPWDAVKALALGARAVGVAGTFLRHAVAGGEAALLPVVEQWLQQLRQLHALLGVTRPADLIGTDVLVRGRMREYCELRGIELTPLARRSESPERNPS